MTVALSMIVKNEAPVIERCLASVADHIDAYFICDTGSTDDTREIIERFFRKVNTERFENAGHPFPLIRGEVVQSSWVDFAHNRNEALRGAEDLADWVLFMDADEIFEGALPTAATTAVEPWSDNGKGTTPGAKRSKFYGATVDGFRARIILGDTTFYRPLLVRSGLPWQFRGAVHEYLMCAGPARLTATQDFAIRSLGDGARNRAGDKFLRDIQVLRAALDRRREPRDVFYLGQSYLLAGFPTEAIRRYEERIAIVGGNQRERWYARYQIARAWHQLGDHDRAVSSYLAAHEAGPERSEPLYHLGMLYFERSEFHAARLFLQKAANTKRPGDAELFVEEPIYAWRALDSYAVACFNCRDYEAARAIVEIVLDAVPEQEVDRVNENLLAIEEAMGEGWEPDRRSASGDRLEGEEEEEGLTIRSSPVSEESQESTVDVDTEPAPAAKDVES